MRLPILGILLALMVAVPGARAHFLELIPSFDIVTPGSERTVTFDLAFSHPMERGPAMELKTPTAFGVMVNGEKMDLLATLVQKPINGKSAFQAAYGLAVPGDYIFFVDPVPYWEAAEGKYIRHFTKVVVEFQNGEGWDQMVGLPVEIEPLVRPYGLWTGNVFRGIVRKGGQPVPFATIEVEWKNDGTVTAPSDPFITQVIKADAFGQFSYALPHAGWWAFAALLDGDEPMVAPDGKPAPVELGALMWVKAVDMKQ